jgi:cbb3-type cytochrome oxidase maturation protein
MEILYLLIPLSVLLVICVLGTFAWALRGGQFDDLDQQGARILAGPGEPLDLRQGVRPPIPEESLPSTLT